MTGMRSGGNHGERHQNNNTRHSFSTSGPPEKAVFLVDEKGTPPENVENPVVSVSRHQDPVKKSTTLK